jgi:hypothetical protein
MNAVARRVRVLSILCAAVFGATGVLAREPERAKAEKIDAEAVVKGVGPSLVVVRVTPKARVMKTPAPTRGVVLDPSGLIAFPCRFTTEEDTVECEFSDGTTLVATALHRDKWTGIAVARVEPKRPLTAIKFADVKGVTRNETLGLSLFSLGEELFTEPCWIAEVREKSEKLPPSIEVGSGTSRPVQRDLLLTGKGELLGIGGVVQFVPSSEFPALLKAVPKKAE